MSSVITPLGLIEGGETVVREIPGVGTVRFENYGPGQWATKKGEPGKTSRRRYLLDDDELDSVSSIVGTLDKPALMYWIEDQATRGAVQAERLGELEDVPEEDWARRVKFLGLGASAKRDMGADRGTVIHAAMHGLTEGRVQNPADFPGTARPWLQGAQRAWLTLNPEKVIASEEIVCHPEHLYAGRPDLVAVVDGQVTLIDYKSSRSGTVYESAHFQTRLYSMALARCGLEIEHILLVGIGNDGNFELVECEVDEASAEALIAVYKARKRAIRGINDQRRRAKAVANG